MTDKKKHKHEEEVTETQPVAESMPVDGEQVTAELETLKSQLAEAESKAAEYKDGWARSQAEFQNYKKRIERDNGLTYASMKGDVIKKILPVLDDLELALQNRPADDAWANGIALVQRKFQSVLESEGVKSIEVKPGDKFDPAWHEAVTHEDHATHQAGEIIAEVQKGYQFGEQVLRPSLVRVAK